MQKENSLTFSKTSIQNQLALLFCEYFQNIYTQVF